MQTILSIMNVICARQIIMAIPLLILVGYFLKHYWPSFPNKAIPEVEIALGIAVGILYAVTSKEGPLAFSIIQYGAQGIVVGALSVVLYDSVHSALPHKCNSTMEESMKEKNEKKPFKPLEHASIVYAIAIVGAAVASGIIEVIFHGVAGAVTYMLGYVHYGILTCVAIDVMLKLTNDRSTLVWQYWVMEAMVVVADVLYVGASITTTYGLMWALLVSAVTVLVGAGIWSKKMYEPAKVKKQTQVLEAVEGDLVELGVPSSIVGAVRAYFFNK